AASHGARILTRTACIGAERRGDLWQATLEDRRTGRRSTHLSRALVNAAGPWVAELQQSTIHCQVHHPLRLVKGSHVVVPRLYPVPPISPDLIPSYVAEHILGLPRSF